LIAVGGKRNDENADDQDVETIDAASMGTLGDDRKLVVALSTKALLVALMNAAVMIPSPGHAKGCIKGAVSADLPATLCIMA
jgi:hypothetical protein